jgi:ferredoxin-like protein FixX
MLDLGSVPERLAKNKHELDEASHIELDQALAKSTGTDKLLLRVCAAHVYSEASDGTILVQQAACLECGTASPWRPRARSSGTTLAAASALRSAKGRGRGRTEILGPADRCQHTAASTHAPRDPMTPLRLREADERIRRQEPPALRDSPSRTDPRSEPAQPCARVGSARDGTL